MGTQENMADDPNPAPRAQDQEGDGSLVPGDQAFVSLYRRFRPGRFQELRGQPHVVRALSAAVRADSVAHAYLFSGPRGTGKTSAARILARALNCEAPEDGEPCGRCASCTEIARGNSLNVHELDAASNNGVEAMRDLVAHAALSTPGRWKVYIVDEVHMLSNAAANALLKTLEEPPGHVVFVLATTDPQKVPPTIRSRTQHFELRLLGAETLEGLLRDVRSAAGLEVDDLALAAAVRRGRGSARDALSALDQMVALGGADESRPTVARVTEVLNDEDPSELLVTVAELHEAGWSSIQLAAELVDELRQAFLLALSPTVAEVTGGDRERLAETAQLLGLAKLVRGMELLGRAQVEMRDAPDVRVVLEVALVRLVRPDLDDTAEALVERVTRLEKALRSAPPVSSGPPGPTLGPSPGGRPAATPPTEARRAPVDQGSSPSSGPGAPEGEESGGLGGPTEGPGQASGAGVNPAPGLPDRDALVEAWGDHILRGLPARAKAFCSAGRFVSLEDGVASFALPNAAHRDRCEDIRPVVEQAIGDYFGVRVPLRLVVEPGAEDRGAGPRGTGRGRPQGAGSPEGPKGPSRSSQSPPARQEGPSVPAATEPDPTDLGDDDFDPDDLSSQVEAESEAHARLLDAFPGAQEVTD